MKRLKRWYSQPWPGTRGDYVVCTLITLLGGYWAGRSH